MSKLLLDEYPLLVSPTLAAKIGLNEAIMLQQINYWISDKRAPERDGRRWHYETYSKWQEQFPFWSIPTIKRIALSLESLGFIITKQFNQLKGNMTKWYSIDYDKYEAFIRGTHGINLIPCHEIKLIPPSDQIDPIYIEKRLQKRLNKTTTTAAPVDKSEPTVNPIPTVVVSKQETGLCAELALSTELMNIGFKDSDALNLVKEFGVKKVKEKLQLLKAQKTSISNPVGWLKIACSKDFPPIVAVDVDQSIKKASAASIEATRKSIEKEDARLKALHQQSDRRAREEAKRQLESLLASSSLACKAIRT